MTTQLLSTILFITTIVPSAKNDAVFKQGLDSGQRANDALVHCRRFVTGWLHHADPITGLIPRNLKRDYYWNAKDSAADNYPFMVLTTAVTDRYLYEHRMRDMLATEIRLTSRVGPLPDDFDFATQTFRVKQPDLKAVVFGASEYVKDGLLPITEWIGPSPWSQRMLSLLDGILEQARIDSPVGKLPAKDHEVGGELMQSLCRAYWMTRKDPYRDMAFRLADYFLLHKLPTDEKRLQLDDHGCEVIAGLSEAYYLAHRTDSARKARYTKPMHRMLDRVLETGRNEDGLMFNRIDPRTGKVLSDELTDNWGYNYLAFLVVAEIDGFDRYRQAVEHVLANVHKYKDYKWERGGADGYADSIEGAINLLNRVPVASAFDWVEHSTRIMLDKQRADGVIEGWHGDGNYARTAIMYALYHTQGTTVRPWRPDVVYGAARTDDGGVAVTISADWPWRGKLLFDIPRHKANWKMPSDYPRLNQFPQWFTVDPDTKYEVRVNDAAPKTHTGRDLAAGLELSVTPKASARIVVKVRDH